MIVSSKLLVDGVTLGVQPAYKLGETEIHAGKFYIMGDDGKLHAPIVAYVFDDPVSYVYTMVELSSSSTYTLTGKCTPVGSTVYVTPKPDELTSESLKQNVIATVVSDDEGVFSVSDISGIDGKVVVWAWVSPVDALPSTMTCTTIVTDTVITGEVLTSSFTAINKGPCLKCNGTGIVPESTIACVACGSDGKNDDESVCTTCGGTGSVYVPESVCTSCTDGVTAYTTPRFTVTGTCPDDIETVFLSTGTATMSEGPDATSLSNSVCVSVTPDKGSYTLAYDCTPDSNYIVWGISAGGGVLTIDNVVVSEGSTSCLSGDTLITMADGSECRLDCVKVGDMVLTEDGVVARVYRTCRGYFNSYHILYTFEDGTVIDETHDHRFYNVDQGFWQLLRNWKIGDHALGQNGEKVALVSIERIDEEAEQFGVWTDFGSYYANGFLSGMAACNKRLLANATVEQAVDMMLSTDEQHLLELIGLEGIMP